MKVTDIVNADSLDIAVEIHDLALKSEELRGCSIQRNKSGFYKRQRIEKNIAKLIGELYVRGWDVVITGDSINYERRKDAKNLKQATLE